MKEILSTFLLAILLMSCSAKEDSSYYSQTYEDAKGASLTIKKSDWYLTRNSVGGGNVNLKISGSTNGDSVTIKTYGDGVISNEKLNLDTQKNFDQDVVISFTATSVPDGEFKANTLLLVYKGSDTLKVALESGNLKY